MVMDGAQHVSNKYDSNLTGFITLSSLRSRLMLKSFFTQIYVRDDNIFDKQKAHTYKEGKAMSKYMHFFFLRSHEGYQLLAQRTEPYAQLL